MATGGNGVHWHQQTDGAWLDATWHRALAGSWIAAAPSVLEQEVSSLNLYPWHFHDPEMCIQLNVCAPQLGNIVYDFQQIKSGFKR
jgi:hypothetical protein